MTYDVANVEVTGGSESILDGIRQAPGVTGGASQYAFSDRGGLVYMPGRGTNSFQLAWVDSNDQV